MKFWDRKTKTYLVLGLSALIWVIHTWHPITLSPTDSGDRTMAMFVVLMFLAAARAGISSARVVAGATFLFFSVINLLIAIVYNVKNGWGNFLEMLFWGLVLGTLGLALVKWKEVRDFEETSLTQNAEIT